MTRTTRRLMRWLISSAVLLGGTGVAYVALYYTAPDGLPRHAKVAGVAIGGLSREAAQEKLETELKTIEQAAIKLGAAKASAELKPKDLGMSIDYGQTVAQSGPVRSWHPSDLFEVQFGGSDKTPVTRWDDKSLQNAVAAFAQEIDDPMVNASIVYKGLTPETTPGHTGTIVDQPATVSAITAAYPLKNTVDVVMKTVPPVVTDAQAAEMAKGWATTAVSAPAGVQVPQGKVLFKPEAIAANTTFDVVADKLTPIINAKAMLGDEEAQLKALKIDLPKNASFSFPDNDKPKIEPSADGEGIDPEKLSQLLVPQLASSDGRMVTMEVTRVKAYFTTEDAEKFGVKEIVGEFSTPFPAQNYRIVNVGLAAKAFNGTMLKPGDTFSYNKVVGPRTVAKGYVPGGSIGPGGKSIDTPGGGICQTVVTLYNAAFFAGYKDIEHTPHSLYFGDRYPAGREATIDYGSVDLKFQNDTPYGAVIQAWTSRNPKGGLLMNVRIWSTKHYEVKSSDLRKSGFYTVPAKEESGEDCQGQGSMQGFSVNFERLFYENGKLVKTEPYKWRYSSKPEINCVP